MPKISIIVPVYNVEPYLRRSMDCLMNQTMKDLEFICIDDCSTDDSLKILREYEAKDSRFKIIALEENQGAAVARNKGLEIAQGEYLGFIDPDDAIDLNYYEELYKKTEEKDYDIIKCALKTVINENTIILSNKNTSIRKNKYNFKNNWQSAIYRTKLIKENNIKFPDECRKAQDAVFLNRVILKAESIECIDDVFYYYYQRENSLDASSIPLKSIESACKAQILIAQDINNSGLFKQDKKQYIKNYYNIILIVFRTIFQNNIKEARELCAQNLIKLYDLCYDKKSFKKRFSYPKMLHLLENQNTEELSEIFYSLRSRDDLEYRYCKPIKKICSIKNSVDKKYKIITLFGIRFKIKRIK